MHGRGARPGAARHPESPASGGLLSRVLVGFLLLYILNVGVEAGVGGWEPTHLETVGYSATLAASATSVYWLMMTAGRFLVVPITLRYAPERILAVFPTGLPWLSRALPQAKRAGAWVIAASMTGGVTAPPLLGVGIEASGIHAVPWLLTALSAASIVATVRLIALTRRASV